MIHVTGSVHEGFTFEIRRNYDYSKSRERPRPPIEIGLMSSEYVVDTPGDGTYTSDSVPQDAFEAMLHSIPAPDKSLRSTSNSVSLALLYIQFITNT